MRHRKSGKTLGRTSSHRKAMFRNMARSLLTHERIRTTEAKAKELVKVMDKLVTLSLKNDLHSRRIAYKTLGNHGLVKRLFDEIGPRFSGGQGGYTRIVKLAIPRKGDCAPMAVVELVNPEESAPKDKKAPKAEAKAAPAPEAKVEEAAVAEAAEEAAEDAKEAVAEEAAVEAADEAAEEAAEDASAEGEKAEEEKK